ncbi:uncharacterized protein C12orf71 homolog [Otolemur garnettii]|uniref:uncharacterized protein C12orf71 homolog n=1 Tax=Otolemur garnettii TaxID=30611 RepID=UPI0006443475|nr:uncharacterized protein C12orf71 homolog [Otolemur garnettii]
MADSSSSDTESCSSECRSNLSLSVGYFPCEDTCEDTTACEDTPSKGSPIHFLPPIQGTWRTGSTGRLWKRQDHTEDNPEQFCKLSIALAWGVDVDSKNADSITNWDLSDDKWIDKYPEERTKLTLSRLDGLVQTLEKFLENENEDEGDVSVFAGSTREEDFQLSSSFPPDMAQISQATGSQKASTIDTSSVSSGQAAEDDEPSNMQGLSCLNFGWSLFRWLRQQVVSSLRRRKPTVRAPKNPHKPAAKKRFSRKCKRIQPQESLEL